VRIAEKPMPPKKVAKHSDSAFAVPVFLDFLGGLVQQFPSFWVGLGNLESRQLAGKLASTPIKAPVYVCGLARSGSTLLHEVLASAPGVATHRMKDYPLVFTPYWWRRATSHLRPGPRRERAHRDRIMVSIDSPDAIEEMLWMAFFPRCHDPSVSNLLGVSTRHPRFETFYRAHLRKLLLAEGGMRYVAKANYHLARLPYLVRLFPDAKFVIPVWSPIGHIASLMRQHQGFSQGERSHPRALRYMKRSGHFEFGLDRRPMNLGNQGQVQGVLDAWAAGQEVRGWARYWAMVQGYLGHLLASDRLVQAAAMVVPFEKLCHAPGETLRGMLHHFNFRQAEGVVAKFAAAIQPPDYYRLSFTSADLAVIEEETAATARAWGYSFPDCRGQGE
jgi:hypothetical protein